MPQSSHSQPQPKQNIREFTFPAFPVREGWYRHADGSLRKAENVDDAPAPAPKRPATSLGTATSKSLRKIAVPVDQLQSLKQQVQELDRETKSLKQKYSGADLGRSTMKLNSRSNHTLDKEAEDMPLADTFRLLKSKYSTLQKKNLTDKQELQVQYDMLQNSFKEQADEIAVLNEKLNIAKNEITTVQNARVNWKQEKVENVVHIKTDYDILQSEYDAVSRRYEQLKGESTALAVKFEEQRTANRALEEQLSANHATSEALNLRLQKGLKLTHEDTIKLASHGYEEEIQILKDQLESLHSLHISLETNHESLKSDYATLESMLSKAKSDVEVQRNETGEWTKKFRQSEEENVRLKRELEVVTGKISSWDDTTKANRARALEYLKTSQKKSVTLQSTTNLNASSDALGGTRRNIAAKSSATVDLGSSYNALKRAGSSNVSLTQQHHQSRANIKNNGNKPSTALDLPLEIQAIVDEDPVLCILGLQIADQRLVIGQYKDSSKHYENASAELNELLAVEREETKNLQEHIESMRITLEKSETDQAGLQENIAVMQASYSEVNAVKTDLEQELASYRLAEAKWNRERQEMQRLKQRVHDMETALQKVEEWKKLVGENQRVGKEVVGLVRGFSSLAATNPNAQVQNDEPREPRDFRVEDKSKHREIDSSLEFAMGELMGQMADGNDSDELD